MKFSKSETKLLNKLSDNYDMLELKIEYGTIFEGSDLYQIASNIYDALNLLNFNGILRARTTNTEKKDLFGIYNKLGKAMRS